MALASSSPAVGLGNAAICTGSTVYPKTCAKPESIRPNARLSRGLFMFRGSFSSTELDESDGSAGTVRFFQSISSDCTNVQSAHR